MTNVHTPIIGAATPPITAKPSTTCPTCGTTKKSKKLSCCARGGSWYKNCGDDGDSKFDHTWTEGVKACKDFVSLLSDEAQRQAMQRHETTPTQLNTTRDPNSPQQQSVVDSFSDSVSDADGKGFSKIAILIGLFLITLNLQL